MKNKNPIYFALMFALTGCATKQYQQSPVLSVEESYAFSCDTVKQEIAKTRSVMADIDATGQFNGRTILGFLGDFGIGNGMAKDEARAKAQARLNQLEALKPTKCSDKS